jgi:uncharacterized protein YcaQ
MNIESLRRLVLLKQGLSGAFPFGNPSSDLDGIERTFHTIEHLGYVQIDTLAVVERAHHHILWVRVPDYHPSHLNQLIQQGRIFEYCFHAAAYLPIKDYRFVLPMMNQVRRGECRYGKPADPVLMKEIMARVRGEGFLRMRDLEKEHTTKHKNSWWSWGAGKWAVNQLFLQGDLVIRERNGMEKIYDLAERVLPKNIDTREPTLYEYANYLLETAVRAHGVVTWKQLLHLKTAPALKAVMRELVQEQLEKGSLVSGEMFGLLDTYIDTTLLDLDLRKGAKTVKILSPFDNVVIYREKLNALFGFDYRLECYLPVSKREFGYFCLPILFGSGFLGRIDCKAHRKDECLEILGFHLEEGTPAIAKWGKVFNDALKQFAAFNGCSHIKVNRHLEGLIN